MKSRMFTTILASALLSGCTGSIIDMELSNGKIRDDECTLIITLHNDLQTKSISHYTDNKVNDINIFVTSTDGPVIYASKYITSDMSTVTLKMKRPSESGDRAVKVIVNYGSELNRPDYTKTLSFADGDYLMTGETSVTVTPYTENISTDIFLTRRLSKIELQSLKAELPTSDEAWIAGGWGNTISDISVYVKNCRKISDTQSYTTNFSHYISGAAYEGSTHISDTHIGSATSGDASVSGMPYRYIVGENCAPIGTDIDYPTTLVVKGTLGGKTMYWKCRINYDAGGGYTHGLRGVVGNTLYLIHLKITGLGSPTEDGDGENPEDYVRNITATFTVTPWYSKDTEVTYGE